MKLAVFDIDGTLTETYGQYDEYYGQAVEETLGIPQISRSWSSYAYSTDSGIMHEACMQALHRPPTLDEVKAAQEAYMRRLTTLRVPAEEVTGASKILDTLESSGRWVVALATGNWKSPAEYKLRQAGLSAARPSATADDAFHRRDIIEIAVQRAGRAYDCPRFERVVYLGDAPWDCQAAASLGLPFVFRRRGRNVEPAASHSLSDWRDEKAVLDALERASIPSREPDKR